MEPEVPLSRTLCATPGRLGNLVDSLRDARLRVWLGSNTEQGGTQNRRNRAPAFN
jgi:hypothetical protein